MRILPRYSPQFKLFEYDWTDELSAILKPLQLAHKYEVDEVHRRLSEFLEQRWPSTFCKCDQVAEHYDIGVKPTAWFNRRLTNKDLVRNIGKLLYYID